jgi:hypothetical protein
MQQANRLGAGEDSQQRFGYLTTELRVALAGEDSVELDSCVQLRPALDDSGATDSIADGSIAIELRALMLRVLADQAAAGRDPALADTVLAECRQLAAPLPTTFRLVPVWLSLAEAEHARASSAPDVVERWTTATARCDEHSLAPHGAYARYRQAQALLASGSRGQAKQPLRDAHAVAQRLRRPRSSATSSTWHGAPASISTIRR